MIIDTSAVAAMLRVLSKRVDSVMSAGTYLECGIVVDRAKDSRASANLDALIRRLRIAIEPLTEEHARLARQAYRDFGKGSGHPAKLNFGDCFAYALAMERGEPLLYKGDDFVHAGLARVV
jgi:ribonuclease VapC